MPKGREDWRIGSAISVLMHLIVLALILTRFAGVGEIEAIEQGAGGAGPAGGGGGGSRGSGVQREALTFVRIAPPPPPAAAVQPRVVPVPPVQEPKVEPPLPKPTPRTEPKEQDSLPVGSGGGTGADSAGGTGPGSGGGVGTGVGSGRGSATGPGTGGGKQTNYSPTPIEMFIPPLPVPESVRGFHVIAEFDVDAHGRVLSMQFTATRDRGYNKRLEEVLKGFRFRPGTTPDGTPMRMKAQVIIDLP